MTLNVSILDFLDKPLKSLLIVECLVFKISAILCSINSLSPSVVC